MDTLKSIFVTSFLLFLTAIITWTVWSINEGENLTLMGATSLEALAPLSFFIWLYAVKPLQTKIYRTGITAVSLLTFVCIFWLDNLAFPTLFSALTFTGWLLYEFWYAKMKNHMTAKETWRVQEWRFWDANDKVFNPFDDDARFRIFVFLRGPWCPFCVAQIRDLADAYEELSNRGVQLNFISSDQKLQSSFIARKFGIKANMLRDKNLKITKRIGIIHKNALPIGMEVLGFNSHHAQPAVIITNESGKVVFTELFDDYRERKSSDYFLENLDKIEANRRETLN